MDVLEGHVKKYMFNPGSPLCNESQDYNKDPSLDDRIHVLVCVLSANMVDIGGSCLRKIADVREEASDLGIPQVTILTKVDEACPVTKKDLKDVYKSKHVKKKNYSEETEQKDDVDALILNALRLIVQFGDDFIEKF